MRLFALAGALMLTAFPALSQSNQLGSEPSPLVYDVSVNGILGYIQASEMQGRFVNEMEDGSGVSKIVEASSNGGSFYFALRECDGPGANARCELVEPFGYFNAAGVTLSQTNSFNMETARVSLAGLSTQNRNQGIIGSKIWLNHGITAEHFGFRVALFVQDIDRLLNAIRPGTLATVKYDADNSDISNSSGLVARDDIREKSDIEFVVNKVGADAPNFLTEPVLEAIKEAGLE